MLFEIRILRQENDFGLFRRFPNFWVFRVPETNISDAKRDYVDWQIQRATRGER